MKFVNGEMNFNVLGWVQIMGGMWFVGVFFVLCMFFLLFWVKVVSGVVGEVVVDDIVQVLWRGVFCVYLLVEEGVSVIVGVEVYG